MLILVVPFLTKAQVPAPSPGVVPAPSPTSPTRPIVIINPFNCAPKTECTIPDLINKIISDILIPIGAVVAVLMIMWAGFLFVTAGGNTTQIDKAKMALLYACIGAALLLGAKVLSIAIEKTIEQLK